jgi:hypothetical protein
MRRNERGQPIVSSVALLCLSYVDRSAETLLPIRLT